MSNKIFSFFILLIINHISYSQNSLNVTINGLVSGDSANVKLTKGTNVLLVNTTSIILLESFTIIRLMHQRRPWQLLVMWM